MTKLNQQIEWVEKTFLVPKKQTKYQRWIMYEGHQNINSHSKQQRSLFQMTSKESKQKNLEIKELNHIKNFK